jgi:Asp/Glu/hydantoin racemase
MSRILVINPNSSVDMTRDIDAGLDVLRRNGGSEITCMTLAEGPREIETQEDVERVVLPVQNTIRQNEADGYVISCFSDPGLVLARETASRPVVGIAESSFLAALGLGHLFGVVAIHNRSIPRHMRNIRALGLEHRLAGDRALDIGVAEVRDAGVVDRVAKVGRTLRDEDHADVIILGCAGMGIYRTAIEDMLGIPVIDPTQVAVARLMGVIALGYARVA